MKEKLYKNKYLIGLYRTKPDDDSLVALCDNGREFADTFNISINNALTTLKNAFDGKTKHFRYNGELLEIYFIEN